MKCALVCVLSDHYPALNFQARDFLKLSTEHGLLPPLILDVFAIDIIAELLDTPLQLLSYLSRRALYHKKLFASHELPILGFHLTYNLWVSAEHDSVTLHDDLSACVDAAVAVRREGYPGDRNVAGVFSRLHKTWFGRILAQIDERPVPVAINLGMFLLTLDEKAATQFSTSIGWIIRAYRKDPRTQGFSSAFETIGVTVICDPRDTALIEPSLQAACEARKYLAKATQWFGLCLHPVTGALRFVIGDESPWEFDSELERMAKLAPTDKLQAPVDLRRSKTGRNDSCSCGSGRKYKKCCLRPGSVPKKAQ